jgi:hypothetical protein
MPTRSDTAHVSWSVVVDTRALNARISGTEVKRLGLTIAKQTVRVVPRVADFWIEQRIGAWVAAYRVVAAKGRPWIGEVRLFPAGDVGARPAGEWVTGTLTGVLAKVPAGGVTAKILADVKPHRWRRVAEHIIRALYRERGTTRMPTLQHFSPYTPKRARSSRGRKPLPAQFYADVAREYDAACRAGRPPAQTLMKKYHAPESRVRGWIHRARRGGFLEGPVLQGKASGTLSLKARTDRARSGT